MAQQLFVRSLSLAAAVFGSLYADDLTFSGGGGTVGTVLRAVPSIVAGEGFHLDAAKTHIIPKLFRQAMTGLVVNGQLNVSRKQFDRSKAMIHTCGRPEDAQLEDTAFRNSLLGKMVWVEPVNPQRGRKLRDLLSAAAALHTANP